MRSKPILHAVVTATLISLTLTGCQSLGLDRYSKYMIGQVPDQYADRTNPLALNKENRLVGKRLYEENCALCHGANGKGDGELSAQLSPRPANLIITRNLPIASDAFFLWTISEGGEPSSSAMPSFGGSLSQKEIWQITQYVKSGI